MTEERDAIPAIDPACRPPEVIGIGAVGKIAFDGGDVRKGIAAMHPLAIQSPDDIGLQLDLALLHLIAHERTKALEIQRRALERQRVFRIAGTANVAPIARRRVLAFVAPGDIMSNTPLEFILDGSGSALGLEEVTLDLLYVVPGHPLPQSVPDHDVAFVAVSESDENAPVLQRISRFIRDWPRPVINDPEKILLFPRDGLSARLDGLPGLRVPAVVRVDLPDLLRIAAGEDPARLLPDGAFPLLVRPVGSHGGKNLEKIDDAAALALYLRETTAQSFYLSPFIDYRSPDGLFRKYRIVFIDGLPFLCHMAVSERWMIHYVNAGMAENPAKRAEEKREMDIFDQPGGFARRHGAALSALQERLGLDYVGIDCGELPDGRLLLFEADPSMVIHAMDSPALYPYKQPQMTKVFAAFRRMIDRIAAKRETLSPSQIPS